MQSTDIEAVMAWTRVHMPWVSEQSALDWQNETSIRLCDHKLDHLPEAFCGLPALKSLDLRRNPLQSLPERIADLQQLKSLELYEAQFSVLPESFTRLKRLEYCKLGAQLTALPADLGNMQALVHLDLSGNQLTVLPDSMQQLTSLKTLRLHDNRFAELPDWIGALPSLQKLDVHYNPLTRLPDSVCQSTTLRSLGYNPLKTTPELACWRAMREGSLGQIQASFARRFSYFGHQLPLENVVHRRSGIAGGDEDGNDYGYGDTVHFVFGKDGQGEYLDFFMAHRLGGDQHGRIREDGSIEDLDQDFPDWL